MQKRRFLSLHVRRITRAFRKKTIVPEKFTFLQVTAQKSCREKRRIISALLSQKTEKNENK